MKKFYLILAVLFVFNLSEAAVINTRTKAAVQKETHQIAVYNDSCDVITLKTGEEIQAKVIEVDLDKVRYKKCGNNDGPVYTLKKSDVFMIKYANGTKDIFNKPTETNTEGPKKGILSFSRGFFKTKYFQDDKEIAKSRFMDLLKSNTFSKNYLTQSNVFNVIGYIIVIIGDFIIALALFYGGLLIGILIFLIGEIFLLIGNSLFNKAVEAYNRNLK